MREMQESIFRSSLRAFFVTLFAILGITAALVAIGFIYYGIAAAVEEESFSSKVKILPDATGRRATLASSAPVILQITIDGQIGSGKLTGKNIQNILLDSREDAFKDNRVKGILLKINSPGGGVNDSDMIYRHIKEYKELYKVPVYTYVDGLCASGGYYIACASDKIFTSGVSLVGSIGVLSWPPFMNLVDALEKIGISTLTLSAGKGKDQMNPFRAWNTDEEKHYQSLLNFYYNKFVDIVAQDRSLTNETLVQEIGARVFPAPEALALGLIDGQGYSRSEVLKELAKAAKIDGKYQVVGFDTKSWWKELFKDEPSSPLLTGKIKHEFALPLQHADHPFSYIFALP